MHIYHLSFFIAECEITTLDASISSNDLNITVEFAADDPNAIYECRLNNKGFVDCKSKYLYRIFENEFKCKIIQMTKVKSDILCDL